MKRRPLRSMTSRRVDRRIGFTLVELMAVIAIIGILSSVLIGALYQADKTSKLSGTRSLIQKMSNMMTARWDAYRTIRLPIQSDGATLATQGTAAQRNNTGMGDRERMALRRLLALRELVRMEMPDRYEDLADSTDPVDGNDCFIPAVLLTAGKGSKPVRPYLWRAYRRKIEAARQAYNRTHSTQLSFGDYMTRCHNSGFESAEMLYLILTTGIDDSSVATEHFSPGDSGDYDQDGMREFHDAWGRPIEFLRWAPGFVSSMQPMFRYNAAAVAALNGGTSPFNANQPTDPSDGYLLSRWQLNVVTSGTTGTQSFKGTVEQVDAFNPLRVGMTQYNDATSGATRYRGWRVGDPAPEYGYFLMPLIYSCGPDGKSGIHHCRDSQIKWSPSSSLPPTSAWNTGANGPQNSDPYNLYTDDEMDGEATIRRGTFLRGQPTDDSYSLDNIHNQETTLVP